MVLQMRCSTSGCNETLERGLWKRLREITAGPFVDGCGDWEVELEMIGERRMAGERRGEGFDLWVMAENSEQEG